MIQSVSCAAGADVGLFTLVLVQPLAELTVRGIDAPTEIDYLTDMASLPQIADDAYLNFLALPNGSLSGAPIIGVLETTWG